MGEIKVVNESSVDIYVSVGTRNGDWGKGGSEGWYLVKAHRDYATWGSRSENQVVHFVRSKSPGASVESVLGVVGSTVYIY